MHVHLGSDHAGYALKEAVRAYLTSRGVAVVDHGAYAFDADDDYIDYVVPVAQAVARSGSLVRGIIFGGSGQGEAIVANRFWGVRAVVFNGQYAPADGRAVPHEIALSREHNDANMLSLGARFLDDREAIAAVAEWLDTPFSGDERHVRRLRKIDALGGIAPGEPMRQESEHTP